MITTNVLSTIATIRRGLVVRRFHQRYTAVVDTVGSHSAGVACIVLALYRGALPSAELLAAALTHDLGEQVTGDIPSPVKKSLDALTKNRLEDMECELLGECGLLYVVTDEEYVVLKFADNLDGFIFCCEELMRGNSLITSVGATYHQYLSDTVIKFGGCPTEIQVSIIKMFKEISYVWQDLTGSKPYPGRGQSLHW